MDVCVSISKFGESCRSPSIADHCIMHSNVDALWLVRVTRNTATTIIWKYNDDGKTWQPRTGNWGMVIPSFWLWSNFTCVPIGIRDVVVPPPPQICAKRKKETCKCAWREKVNRNSREKERRIHFTMRKKRSENYAEYKGQLFWQETHSSVTNCWIRVNPSLNLDYLCSRLTATSFWV